MIDPETSYSVAVDGCWLWTRAKQSMGYGHFVLNGRHTLAHRWFYQKYKGAIPAGLVLDHRCRKPACVNPSHLEAVTIQVNTSRGIGIGRPRTVSRLLTHAEKEAMRVRRADGESTYALAKEYQVSAATCWRICGGREGTHHAR